jgi:hypothetical protein
VAGNSFDDLVAAPAIAMDRIAIWRFDASSVVAAHQVGGTHVR